MNASLYLDIPNTALKTDVVILMRNSVRDQSSFLKNRLVLPIRIYPRPCVELSVDTPIPITLITIRMKAVGTASRNTSMTPIFAK